MPHVGAWRAPGCHLVTLPTIFVSHGAPPTLGDGDPAPAARGKLAASPSARGLLPRLALALGLAVALSGCEELVYHPIPLTPTQEAAIRASHPQAEPLEIAAADGVALRGWLLPGSRPDHPLVLYFGGNAEEVSWLLDHPEAFGGWDVALVNYRGYGRSDGRPRERDLLADAVAVYDHLVAAGTPRRVALLGRSLGSAVATYLASQRPVACVVLVAPFDSAGAVGGDALPFVPVSWVIGDVYDAVALAPAIDAPLRVIVASHDRIVARERSRRLFDAWGGSKEWVTIEGADHNDIQAHRSYWDAIQSFLVRHG
jgi:pimeloyl-ACP methyl ester carboxylesterase